MLNWTINRLKATKQDEGGFTLIELLVVILIIGILAAIALPSFLGQQKKGQDATAMSNARNAVTQVESCFTTEQTYANCTTYDGQPAAGSATAVTVTGGADNFTISAKSESDGNQAFVVRKFANGSISRSCTASLKGACKANGSW